jgi:hypothetical protein
MQQEIHCVLARMGKACFAALRICRNCEKHFENHRNKLLSPAVVACQATQAARARLPIADPQTPPRAASSPARTPPTRRDRQMLAVAPAPHDCPRHCS